MYVSVHLLTNILVVSKLLTITNVAAINISEQLFIWIKVSICVFRGQSLPSSNWNFLPLLGSKKKKKAFLIGTSKEIDGYFNSKPINFIGHVNPNRVGYVAVSHNLNSQWLKNVEVYFTFLLHVHFELTGVSVHGRAHWDPGWGSLHYLEINYLSWQKNMVHWALIDF